MSVRRVVYSCARVAAVLGGVAFYAVTSFPLIGAPMQEARGVLSRIDVSRLPPSLQAQVEARVGPYRNAPFSTDIMLRLRADISAIDRKIVQNWVQEGSDGYSVSFAYEDGGSTDQPVLVRIDTSRLPEPLRSQVEARVSSFVNAPFNNALMSSIQSAVGLIDRKIAYRWSSEPGGNQSLTLLYDSPDDGIQTVHGVLARIDVSRLPEPVRTQMEQRLARYRNAAYTNALMREISRDAYGVAPRVSMRWQVDRPGVFSLTISDEPAPTGPRPLPPNADSPNADFPSDGEQQIRVGGQVQAAKLKASPDPVYPPPALEARIQGIVRFNVQIGTDGRVKRMQLVSGHPLMIQSAKDALARYEYETTLLNGEPVQVVTTVDVNFSLN